MAQFLSEIQVIDNLKDIVGKFVAKKKQKKNICWKNKLEILHQ